MWILSLVIVALMQGAGNQQPAAPEKSGGAPNVQVPHAAADILRRAAETNGLDAASAKSWHVKFSFDQFDDEGDNTHSGTVEEFYVGPKKWKRIFESDTTKQTDIASGSGLYRSGDQRWLSPVEMRMLDAVFHPLDPAHWERFPHSAEKKERQVGGVRLNCVEIQRTDRGLVFSPGPAFCFDPNSVALRYVRENLAFEATYNEIVPFQGHYVARKITLTRGGRKYLSIQVDLLEESPKVDDSFFAPAPDSVGPLGGRIALSSGILMDYLLSHPDPVYPSGAEGKVNVHFVVGKDGHVIEATALDGPERLRKPVVETVRKYRFRPFMVLDQPVEVESSTSLEVHSR